MLSKNDEIELHIDSLGSDGEGIGRTKEGITVFVTDAFPGDVILAHITKVKKTYAYAFAKEIITPSSDRVKAKCPVAKKCGGCTLQNLSYAAQLSYKEEKVKGCIERIGGIKNPLMEPIVGAEDIFYYRNKAQFPVGKDENGKAVIGFYRRHSHDVVACTACAIQNRVDEDILNVVERYLQDESIPPYNEETKTGLVRHVFIRVGQATNEVIVCLVVTKPAKESFEKLALLLQKVISDKGMVLKGLCLNINDQNTNVIMGTKLVSIYGDLYITDTIGDISYRISPLSFYQVNPQQTKKLYDLALEYAGLTGTEIVWDLYCGIGTISLYMAKKAKEVYGVEIVPEAIEDARENAKRNKIENARFTAGAAEEVAPSLPAPDVICVDPPRKGCDEKLIATILENAPKRIVYVSCDPATLARDLKLLTAGGYHLEKVRPVDQFCHTPHVETVCLLSRKDN